MVKVSIKQEKLDQTELVLVKQFEYELAEYVRKILNQKKYPLKVGLTFEINERTNQTVSIEHNASFSIPNSIEMALLIKEYVEKQHDILQMGLRQSSLIVHCEYTDNMEMQQKSPNSNSNGDDKVTIQFIPQKPIYSFEQIILPDTVREEIYDALKVIECKDTVYNVWGFSEIDPVPRSVLSLYGEPGTGKTMCAHAIAKKLNRKILALNYAEIESKYLGESAKNLQKAFDVAIETESVLFFDESDSFLGKRIQNVTQGSEQALNSLRSQMLILLEKHPGIVVFATNLVTNYDKAFESRILKHIRFELPNHEARIAIIKKMIPSKLPLSAPISDEVLNEASDMLDGFSGREIKSVILELLLSKAQPNPLGISFSGDEFIEAFKKKKVQKEHLKEEENKRIKERIAQKLGNVATTTPLDKHFDSNETATDELFEPIRRTNELL